MIFLIVLHYLWILIKGLELIYYFQIKEYRFDRLFSQIKETGFVPFFYSVSLKFPKKSMRNFLLTAFLLTFATSVALYSFEQIYLYNLLTYTILFAPVFAYIIVASGVLWTSIPSYLMKKITQIKAARLVNKSHSKFIGITGSYGKTSTKEFLYQILSTKYKTGKTEENMNTAVGIALSICKNLAPDTEYFIIELGAYKKGELKEAASYLHFDKIILTGLGNQHLSLYGSRENLEEEESFPITKLAADKSAYVNYTVPNISNLKKLESNVITYGLNKNSDVKLKNLNATKDELSGKIEYKKQTFSIRASLLGKHSLANLMPGIALAFDLGMNKDEIEKAVLSIKAIPGKLSKHQGYGGATVIFDGANSNVDGFMAAIEAINLFPQKNKIIVTQGIIELGVEKWSSYNKLVSLMTYSNIKLFSTDKLFSKISKNKNAFTFNDVLTLAKEVRKRLNKGTILLIEGKFSEKIISYFIKKPY